MWTDLLADLHPWLKALHIISVIAWMAGLLYLPRLFVYHAEAPAGSEQSETFKVMERRLLRGIMNPAMVAAFIFGIMLLLTPGMVDWGAAGSTPSSCWSWRSATSITRWRAGARTSPPTPTTGRLGSTGSSTRCRRRC